MTAGAGLARAYRVIRSTVGTHVFVADGSRLYDVADADGAAIAALLADPGADPAGAAGLETAFGGARRYIDDTIPEPPPVRALSLNVAQACNLGCTYCYADTGLFGGTARQMRVETARATVDRLIAETAPGDDFVLGFMGGEPLLNRKVVHDATAYAAERAAATGRRARFAVTTNATLLSDADAALFRRHRFTVTVSLDGTPERNDRQRPTRKGEGSYAAAVRGLERLTADGGPGHLSARVTVVPGTTGLLETLEHLLGLGVGDAGFAPVQVSPDAGLEFQTGDFDTFLSEMIRCGEAAKRALLDGRRFAFSNFETALHEIHRGGHRPYPCGAGAGYLSVNADGDLYGCHRLIDSDGWEMGTVADGPDDAARRTHLETRHVDRQEPCRSCWARYLCGGGCYHEVDRRGRLHCDYVRGWLEFCLASYAELSQRRPEYFRDPHTYFARIPPQPRA